jgi:hypothetical protein
MNSKKSLPYLLYVLKFQHRPTLPFPTSVKSVGKFINGPTQNATGSAAVIIITLHFWQNLRPIVLPLRTVSLSNTVKNTFEWTPGECLLSGKVFLFWEPYSPHSWTILEGENPRILQKIRFPVFQCSRVHDVGRTLVVFPNKSEAFKLTMNAGLF